MKRVFSILRKYMKKGFFYIFLVIALAVTLPACAVGEKLCDYRDGPCDYGGGEALFNATPEEGIAPLEVQFYDQSTGNPIKWQWDFGDGTNSIEQYPKHLYTKPGKYSVTLWIKNDFNSGALVRQDYILVSDVPKEINVVTHDATSVTSTGATLHGAVTDMGGKSRVAAFFKYGTDPTLTVHTPMNAGALSSPGVFSAGISGLTTGTTYYFQACATTDTMERCGEILSVTPTETCLPTPTPTETPTPCPPMPTLAINTAPATNVIATSAILNGEFTDMGGESTVAVFFK
jgi:PKD repeat protein